MRHRSDVFRALGVPMRSNSADAAGAEWRARSDGQVAPGTANASTITPADWVYDQRTGTLAHGAVCYADGHGAAGMFAGGRTPAPNTGVVREVYPENYAGHGAGLNNPGMDGVSGKRPAPSGPLPAGRYNIGPIGTQIVGRSSGQGHALSDAMRLTPDPSNDMKGRAGFLFHGGRLNSPTSSEGCIVTPPDVRRSIDASGDHTLWVVPGRQGL